MCKKIYYYNKPHQKRVYLPACYLIIKFIFLRVLVYLSAKFRKIAKVFSRTKLKLEPSVTHWAEGYRTQPGSRTLQSLRSQDNETLRFRESLETWVSSRRGVFAS